jgi:ferredoxin
MKVKVDRELCMGVGSCVAVAPEVFKIDEEFKAVVLKPESVGREKLLEAAEACPYQAIILEEDNGEQVFP